MKETVFNEIYNNADTIDAERIPQGDLQRLAEMFLEMFLKTKKG